MRIGVMISLVLSFFLGARIAVDYNVRRKNRSIVQRDGCIGG